LAAFCSTTVQLFEGGQWLFPLPAEEGPGDGEQRGLFASTKPFAIQRMNPLVKKEIRLLLPTFLIGVALTFSILFLPDIGSATGFRAILIGLPFLLCPAMAVMMALGSFGAEVSHGTFSGLLAQPVPRTRIWQVKVRLLAAALFIGGVLWCGLFYLRFAPFRDPQNPQNYREVLVCAWMFLLVVFSGGLWTVLLLRQVAAAFWFTVLVPGAILVLTISLAKNLSDAALEGVLVAVFLVYSLAGIGFARWLFFRAQDLQWSGGTIALPEMRGLARFKSFAGARRMWRPRAALWRKEIQLHQSQFVIAFVLLVLHLGVIVTRHWGHYSSNSTTELVLDGFWMLWLVMPLLVGCAAVAEERKLGTHEGQICLPVKRRTQFAVKLLVALGLSVALGVFMPLLLEGSKILPENQIHANLPHGWEAQATTAQIIFWNGLEAFNQFLPLLSLAGIAVLIGGISYYASTLSRNTLQTLAPAVAGVVLAWFLILVTMMPSQLTFELDSLWRGALPYFIVLPAMVLALLALAYSNFQNVMTGWKLGRRNLLALASVFALTVTLTSAIYHRAWEKLTPFEPPHGAARLTLANPANLSREGQSVSVHLPDGRTWMAGLSYDPKISRLGFMLGNIKLILNDPQFISGTNWLTVKRDAWELSGIQTDGTLWVSEKPMQAYQRQGQWTINEDEVRHLVPFGTETNWSSLLSFEYSVWLTKADGTLWRWGATNFNYNARTNRWPGLRAFTPERLGTESNWAEVFQAGYVNSFRKTDGSIWTLSGSTNGQSYLEIAPGYTLVKITESQAAGKFRSTALVYNGLQCRVGVRDDGTFRIFAHELLTVNSHTRYSSYEWFPADLQIGTGTNWLAVASGGDKVVTLKDDGTLWLWDFHRIRTRTWDQNQLEQGIVKTVPVRLGTHSDWIAISGNVTTLAADGSLWFWPLGESGGTFYDDNNHRIPQLLDISRKPQFLGNVFGKPD
jgi:hypothetical protein